MRHAARRSCWVSAAALAGALVAGMPAHAAVLTFANSAAITTPPSGPGSPYPSVIAVTGIAGTVTRVTVTLFGLGHVFPEDLDVLLVGPSGANVMLMSDVGYDGSVAGLTLTFDQAASASLPDGGPLVSGTFRPTDATSFGQPDNLAAPAPAPPYGSSLDIFSGLDPNGVWSLFAFDAPGVFGGTIEGGWELTLTVDEAVAVPAPGTLALLVPGLLAAGLAARRHVRG